MNYLSHLYLSQRTPESFTGNLMGDFKPTHALLDRLPEGIKLGIENHRLVDRLTDKYQPVKALRTRFSKQRRRYAGIITDIAFDYYLIKHWDAYEEIAFSDFVQEAYRGLARCTEWMPDRMAYVTQQMRHHDWLSSYANLHGIGLSIDQVSKRLRFPNNMAGGIVEVETLYSEIEAVFLELFEHLRIAVEDANLEGRTP